MTFSYMVDERTKRITIWLNNYEKEGQTNYSFWTETQVDKIPDLLKVLKKIKKSPALYRIFCVIAVTQSLTYLSYPIISVNVSRSGAENLLCI